MLGVSKFPSELLLRNEFSLPRVPLKEPVPLGSFSFPELSPRPMVVFLSKEEKLFFLRESSDHVLAFVTLLLLPTLAIVL